MKSFMKKRKLLCLAFLVLPIFACIVFYSYSAAGLYKLSCNSFYFTDSLYLQNTPNNNLKNKDFLQDWQEIFKESRYVYRHFTKTFRGVMVNRTSYALPVSQGRFFQPKDNDTTENLAVVGESYLAEATSEDGKNIISYKGQEYRLLGILDSRLDAKLSKLFLVNLASCPVETLVGEEGYWVADGSHKKCIENLANQDYLSDVKQISVEPNNIFGNRDITKYVRQILAVFCLAIVIAYVYIIKYVNFFSTEYFYVSHVLGFSGKYHTLHSHYENLLLLGGISLEIGVLTLLGNRFFYASPMGRIYLIFLLVGILLAIIKHVGLKAVLKQVSRGI